MRLRSQADAFIGTRPGHCPYIDAAIDARHSHHAIELCRAEGLEPLLDEAALDADPQRRSTANPRRGSHKGRRKDADSGETLEWRRTLKAQGDEELTVALQQLRANEQASQRWLDAGRSSPDQLRTPQPPLPSC